VTRLAVAGAAGELVAEELMVRGMDPTVRRGYSHGRARLLLRASKVLAVAGAAGAVAGAVTGSRAVRAAAGVALLAASACTRFGVFHAGISSAQDPEATIGPQRARVEERSGGEQQAATGAPTRAHPTGQPAAGQSGALESTAWRDNTSIPSPRQSDASIPVYRERDGGEPS
jgi:hypothetical protein